MATIPKEVSDYLARIGRKGGKVGGKSTSKRKQATARANGHKGGRPRKFTRILCSGCSGCSGSLTSADVELGACTQCGKELKP